MARGDLRRVTQSAGASCSSSTRSSMSIYLAVRERDPAKPGASRRHIFPATRHAYASCWRPCLQYSTATGTRRAPPTTTDRFCQSICSQGTHTTIYRSAATTASSTPRLPWRGAAPRRARLSPARDARRTLLILVGILVRAEHDGLVRTTAPTGVRCQNSHCPDERMQPITNTPVSRAVTPRGSSPRAPPTAAPATVAIGSPVVRPCSPQRKPRAARPAAPTRRRPFQSRRQHVLLAVVRRRLRRHHASVVLQRFRVVVVARIYGDFGSAPRSRAHPYDWLQSSGGQESGAEAGTHGWVLSQSSAFFF